MSAPKLAKDIVYTAIDTADKDHAVDLARKISPVFGGVKLGLEFYMKYGASGVTDLMNETDDDTSLFLDLKLHDIPNTVKGAVSSVAEVRPKYLTIHAGGGNEMMHIAAQTAEQETNGYTQILAVTVLTSLSSQDLKAFSADDGNAPAVEDTVLRLTENAIKAGCSGVVCSPLEIEVIRRRFGDDVTLMVPGIRLAQNNNDDQKRVMSPVEAYSAGATHMVIGRAVTNAPDPQKAAADILDMLKMTEPSLKRQAV